MHKYNLLYKNYSILQEIRFSKIKKTRWIFFTWLMRKRCCLYDFLLTNLVQNSGNATITIALGFKAEKHPALLFTSLFLSTNSSLCSTTSCFFLNRIFSHFLCFFDFFILMFFVGVLNIFKRFFIFNTKYSIFIMCWNNILIFIISFG